MYAGGDSTVIVEEFSGEITAEKIDEIAEGLRAFGPEVVAGMGGGKTMDTAKAVSDIFESCYGYYTYNGLYGCAYHRAFSDIYRDGRTCGSQTLC